MMPHFRPDKSIGWILADKAHVELLKKLLQEWYHVTKARGIALPENIIWHRLLVYSVSSMAKSSTSTFGVSKVC